MRSTLVALLLATALGAAETLTIPPTATYAAELGTITVAGDALVFAANADAPINARALTTLPRTFTKSVTVKAQLASHEGFDWNNFALVVSGADHPGYVGGFIDVGPQQGGIMQYLDAHAGGTEREGNCPAPMAKGAFFPVELTVDLAAKTVTFKVKSWSMTKPLTVSLSEIGKVGVVSYRTGVKVKELTVTGE